MRTTGWGRAAAMAVGVIAFTAAGALRRPGDGGTPGESAGAGDASIRNPTLAA